MRVSELMSKNVETIEETSSCRDAVERMVRAKIRHLPVVDRLGRLVGVVTDRDLRHHLFEPTVLSRVGSVSVDRLLAAVPVARVMSSPVVTVQADEPLETAARMMLEDKVGSIPVLEGDRIVGIITETDLLRRVVGENYGAEDVECIVVSYP